MAARQDQTLQILSICLVGLVVILGGFLIAVNRWKADYRQQAEAAEEKARNAENATRAKQEEVEAYLDMIGFKQFDNLEAVRQQFEADMQNYGSSFAETDRKYREILETLAAEIDNSAEQESQAKKRLQDAEERLKETITQKDAQIAEYKKQMEDAKSDNAKLRTEFNDARAKFEKVRDELKNTLAKNNTESRKAIGEVQGKLAEAEKTLAKRDQTIDKFIEERKVEDPSFEVSDGRVTWVNQANRTVWINLGEQDSLRPQVTFSVYQQDLADAGKSEKKGSVEVVRLLDDHLAEARITSDSARNPIMPGDHIYSPVWHEGKKVHFAFVGNIDLDSDGHNDIAIAKDLVGVNGGVVDAAMDNEGNVEGEMSVETRYLVIGDYPKSGVYKAAEKRQAWKQMTTEAENVGVESITLQEFLNQMGYRPMDRSVGLGRNARPEDFKSLNTGNRFRERSPYVPISN